MALPALKATSAAIVQLCAPVIAALGGLVLLGEPITMRLALACVAILGGIALAILEKRNGNFAGLGFVPTGTPPGGVRLTQHLGAPTVFGTMLQWYNGKVDPRQRYDLGPAFLILALGVIPRSGPSGSAAATGKAEVRRENKRTLVKRPVGKQLQRRSR